MKIKSLLCFLIFLVLQVCGLSAADYYVKTTGAGDGSSWENAMSADDFAYLLANVPDGTVFHLAEGVYKPIYDFYGEVPGDFSSRQYTIKSCVTIVGGYLADAKTGAVSEPDKYETVFDADILGDEAVEGEDGFLLWGSASKLFQINSDVDAFKLDGVVVKNAEFGIDRLFDDDRGSFSISVSNSRFEYCDNAIYSISDFVSTDSLSLDVSNSVFYRNGRCCFIKESKDISFSNVRFEENNTMGMTYIHGNYTLEIENVEVVSNYSGMIIKGYGDVVVRNSKFERCCDSSNFFDLQTHGNASFVNCQFEENIALILLCAEVAELSLDSCRFVGNNTRIDVSLEGKSLVLRNTTFESEECRYLVSNAKVGYGVNSFASCGFYGNKCSQIMLVCDGLSMSNSTLVGNEYYSRFIDADTLSFANNTLLGNYDVSGGTYSSPLLSCVSLSDTVQRLYGNIILGNGVVAYDQGYENLAELGGIDNVSHNLMNPLKKVTREGKEIWTPDNETNIFVRPFDLPESQARHYCATCQQTYPQTEQSILEYLFEGTYDAETHIFTPVLDSTSGFAPTVALKSDKLPDGTSIRFPITETTVSTDQRGEKRSAQTCMGAYEIGGKGEESDVDDVKSDGICIYPNPAADFIQADGIGQRTYKIFDFQGRLVADGLSVDGRIPVGALQSGTYALFVDGKSVGVFVKVK